MTPADADVLRHRVRGPTLVEPVHLNNDVDLLTPLRNDTGNAERIIRLRGEGIRYCHAKKSWLCWDGRRWAVDDTHQVHRVVKEVMLGYLQQAIQRGDHEAEKFAKHSLDAKRIAWALAMAECELPVTPETLDAHPFLLNFQNGVVDLRTGALGPHQRELFLTKLVHFNYNPEAKCPTFLAFLARIFGAGPGASEAELARAARLIEYLRRAWGYSLTGSTAEKAIFIAHGGGGNNGKTTLLNTFRKVFEEYATLLQIDSLMTRQESSNSQADLADLRGARFVMTSETEEGQRLAEGKLKRITQGTGRIKAVRKYENPIEFDETHKIWMDANHKPVVRGTDNAIWNRLHPIPFDVSIPIDEIDRELPAKLIAEGEGILAWGVSGAVRYHKEGLGKPPEIEAAVADYRNDMDQLDDFIEEVCIVEPTQETQARELFSAYMEWAQEANGPRLSQTAFGTRMSGRGFAKKHEKRGTFYHGIGLKNQ